MAQPTPTIDAVAEATPQPATSVAAEPVPVPQTEAQIMKNARKNFCHWMRKLKRPTTREGVDKMTLEELTEQTPALKLEHEAIAEKAREERAAAALVKEEAKAARAVINKQKREVQAQEAQDRKDRTVWYTFDTNEILEKVKAQATLKGELEFCKFVVVSGVGKMPGIQVRYTEASAAKAMADSKSETIPFTSTVRLAPQAKRAITFILPAEVTERGGEVYAATMALTEAKVEGITNVSWNQCQITIEFATEAAADLALEVVKKGLTVKDTKLELADARKGLSKKNKAGGAQNGGANKKRKVE